MRSRVVSGIILTLLVVSVFTGFAPVKGVEGVSYIIVHALNPEGIEIASIKQVPWEPPTAPVDIYDETTLIGHGAHDNDTYNKPIAISPGAHTIRVEFNGMTLEQSVNIQEEETEVLTFTFDRTEYPIGSWINGLGVDGEVAVSTSAFLNASETCSVQKYQVHPDLRLSVSFNAGIETETGKYSNVSYDGVAKVSLGSHSYYESWRSDFSCSGNTNVSVHRVGLYEGTLDPVPCSFASPHSEFENWYVQNIQHGWYPEIRISGYGGSGWLCGHNLYPDFGYHEIRLIDASVAYTYYSINKYAWEWLSQYFGESWPYWYHKWHPPSSSEHFTAEFSGSLKIKMSSVPYDLAGTGIKYEENQHPVAAFTYRGPKTSHTPSTIYVGSTVKFDAENSYDPDGHITSYTWDFGDNTSTTETDEVIYHAYLGEGWEEWEQPQVFTVTLTVTDNQGASNTIPQDIPIHPLEWEVYYEIDYMTGHKPTASVLEYISGYFRDNGIYIDFKVNDEISPADSSVTTTEFWQYEKDYNDVWKFDDRAQGDKSKGKYNLKEKWVLFGTVVEDKPKTHGKTYANTKWGNYVFVADQTNDKWASSQSPPISIDKAETVALMHEIGHTIGILLLDRDGEEDYDNTAWSVMAKLSEKNCNRRHDAIRYSPHYWKLRNMEYYTR